MCPEVGGALILFGGRDQAVFGDTWRWNGNSWLQLAPSMSPPARLNHTMAYDSHRGVVVLFGGIASSEPSLDDTWEWNGANWTQMPPASNPSGLRRRGHAMAYDPIRQRTVLFGGHPIGLSSSNETWEWDGITWLQRFPSSVPAPRSSHAMCWDDDRQRIVLFGGAINNQWASAANDTWDWDGTNWAERTPALGPNPVPRVEYAMTYDRANRQVVLFGGATGGLSLFWDTWTHEPLVRANVNTTGPGCAGVLGTPSLTAAPGSSPWLGDTLTTNITGLPTFFPVPLLVAGFSDPSAAGLFCRPDCTLRTTPDVVYSLNPVGNQATWSLTIPNNPTLLGANLFAQAVTFNFATVCTDSMSNGIQITIGGR